jgi:uncharacterized repeat protein (TIGR01451 family)
MTAEPPQAHVGDTITYTYYLKNSGNLPFNNVSVNNDVAGPATYQSGDTNNNSVLNPGETWVFTATYTVKAGDPSPLVATATVSGVTETFVTVTAIETASTPILPAPGIDLDKVADPDMAYIGDNITYTYTVTNTGDTALGNVTVTDDLIESVVMTGGDGNENGLLDTDETWTFTANYTVGPEAPDTLVNTANVTGTYGEGETVAAADSASVAILKPGLALDKDACPAMAHVGDNITYTYTVTNTGNIALGNITVKDDMIEAIAMTGGDGNENELLDTGEIWTYTADYVVGPEAPDALVNTANVTGRYGDGETVAAADSASVAVLKPGISLEKSAAPLHEVEVDDDVTYTFTVTNTGNTPLTNIILEDSRVDNIILISNGNGDDILDAGETWVFSATYTITEEDTCPVINTATVSGRDELQLIVTDEDTAVVTLAD